MNITSISDYYKRLLDTQNKKTTSSSTNNKVDSISNADDNSISTKNLSDTLDLSSSSDNLGYLNYNAKGQYNTQTLANALNGASETDITDLFDANSFEGQETSLADYLDSGSSTETDYYSKLVDNIISQITAYDNKLISQALKRAGISTDSSSTDASFMEKVKKL